MVDQLHALHASAERLRGIVESLEPSQLTDPAYPREWTIADTLSHLGSGAVIMRATLDAVVSGAPLAEGFNQSVWDEWNAKSPADQAAGVVVADRAFLERVEALTDDERASLQFPFGPMTLGLAEALGMRLNEHAVHTWDVEVVLDPTAVIPEQSAEVILGSLPMIARFAAKDDGDGATSRSDQPTCPAVPRDDRRRERALTPGAGDGPAVELPAESFVRLVYGRLDADHTPADVDAAAIAALRPLFPASDRPLLRRSGGGRPAARRRARATSSRRCRRRQRQSSGRSAWGDAASMTRQQRQVDQLRALCGAGQVGRAVDLAFEHFATFGRDDRCRRASRRGVESTVGEATRTTARRTARHDVPDQQPARPRR